MVGVCTGSSDGEHKIAYLNCLNKIGCLSYECQVGISQQIYSKRGLCATPLYFHNILRRKQGIQIEESFLRDDRLMAHDFLGIKVKQSNKGTFISQASYAQEILKKFSIRHYQLIDTPNTPIECRTKLTK